MIPVGLLAISKPTQGATGPRIHDLRHAFVVNRMLAWYKEHINPQPHTFRHATAVSLVAAGVDVTVIRSWLGHASLDTANRFARANLETKRKALEKVGALVRPAKPPRWKRNADLMAWLDSL